MSSSPLPRVIGVLTMPPPRKIFLNKDYTVGWICALPLEMAAAKAMLDEIHTKLPQPPQDQNGYELGEVFGHKVVITCLPSGVMGVASSASVVTQMLYTFPKIQFGLMVGIGAGVPSQEADVRLGDIVVSHPRGTLGGVVQYDYGKTIINNRFERIGTLNKPPQVLLTALSDLQSNHMMGMNRTPEYLAEMIVKYPAMSRFRHPGTEDLLFQAEYEHGPGKTCKDCDRGKLVSRDERDSNGPEIHYGLIASGNQVMKHGRTRDKVAQALGIICFEMEAAGLMDRLPSLVIRGICDYADSHKNKEWQGYAAAAAAAYAKDLLSNIPVGQMEDAQSDSNGEPRDLQSLDPTLDEDQEKLYRQFRKSLPKDLPVRDESLEEPLKVTMLQEILTWKFHAQGPWDVWFDRHVVDDYNLNVRNGWGKTPLHYAVTANQSRLAKVRKLLGKGADLTMMDYEGNTPVDIAKQLGDETVLAFLLRSWVKSVFEDDSR